MKERNVSHEVEETLNIATQVGEVAPPPFFYTRLKARMENELESSPRLKWILKPALVVPTLLLVIGMNVYTLVNLNELPTTEEAFTESYNLNTSDDINLY